MMAEYEERRKESGDQRVPSDPDHYQPANVPPAPLTKSERYNKEEEGEE
jgi:hypothetical protein